MIRLNCLIDPFEGFVTDGDSPCRVVFQQVELECVLPGDMPVRDAHDIALDLQQKVEAQPNVERCFVHIDYVARPGVNEHKI